SRRPAPDASTHRPPPAATAKILPSDAPPDLRRHSRTHRRDVVSSEIFRKDVRAMYAGGHATSETLDHRRDRADGVLHFAPEFLRLLNRHPRRSCGDRPET